MVTQKFYVYLHKRSLDGGVFYVGKGSKKRAWKKTSRSDYWKRIENKYGRTVEIYRDNLEEHEAFELEKELIAHYGRENLCNFNDGGYGGINPSEETRLKMSIAKKGRIVSYETKARNRIASFGRKHSEETKAKISAYFAGRKRTKPVTDQERLNRRNARIGIVFSETHKKRISESKKGKSGKKLNDYQKECLRNANIGKIVSEETKKKIGDANRGKKHTDKTKKIMSEKSKKTNEQFKKKILASNGMRFNSISDSVRWLRENGYPLASNGNITSCCVGRLKSAYGLVWCYNLDNK
jgi:hypothetical protein